MSDAFSTPAEHAFDHPELSAEVALAVAGPSSMGDAVADVALEEAFEVDQTVAVILNGGYKTIGLQFPDELLPSSVSVFKAIQTRIAHTGAQAYVLADSTYGSCCPDVLSCLHLPADLLVHYGHTCLTATDALPVHYVFPRRKLDISDVVQRLRSISEDDFLPGDSAGKGLIVVWDVAFDWLADSLVDRIRNDMPFPTSFSRISLPDGKTSSSQDRKGKAPALRTIQPPEDIAMEDCVIWYIGEEGRSLVNMQMTHANLPLYAYLATEKAAKAIHPTTSRLLSRRLFAVHQAMSSDVFGLIVGNVGLASSQELLQQLRDALKKEKKKSYTLSVGRLNPAKLANFETIECFVLVGCAEGGVVDSKEFLRPIITPWEMLLALKGADGGWDPSKWTLDLTKVLEESHQARNPNDEDGKDDEPVFSLVTGSYRSRKVYGDGTENGTPGIDGVSDDVKSLTIRNNEFTLAKLESAGSHYLQSREFKGLEPRRGMDEPSALEEGRSGVARGYGEER